MVCYGFDFGEQESGFRLKDRHGVIGSGECLHCFYRVEKVHDDKFRFLCPILPQDIRTAMAVDALKARDYLLTQELLVGVGILGRRPTFPHSRDHSSTSLQNAPIASCFSDIIREFSSLLPIPSLLSVLPTLVSDGHQVCLRLGLPAKSGDGDVPRGTSPSPLWRLLDAEHGGIVCWKEQ